MESFPDHFSPVSEGYSQFRPRYPAALFEWLASLPTRHEQVWDVGTGNGQAALDLVPYFPRILATDASQAQIREATPHPKIEYRVSPADQSDLPAGSVDLITVAQALHWFDLPAFYAEATRVLAPGGVVAAWTYGILQHEVRSINDRLQHFYSVEMGPWWPPNRHMVETSYRTVPFPFREISAPPFEISASMSLPDLVGYLRTWSSVIRFSAGRGYDPVTVLERDLTPAWGDPSARSTIRWPIGMRVGRF